jgi:phosphopantetheinyl transferase
MMSRFKLPLNEQNCSLTNNDHLWVVNNFAKKTASVLQDPLVNTICANYLPHEEIQFVLNEFGKPSLKMVNNREIHISISHSHNILAVLFSSEDSIGIDIEYIKNRRFTSAIVNRYRFSKNLTFYQSWTAREAFIKAIGSGLFKNLSQIQLIKKNNTILVGISNQFSHHIDYIESISGFTTAICRRIQNNKSLKSFHANVSNKGDVLRW